MDSLYGVICISHLISQTATLISLFHFSISQSLYSVLTAKPTFQLFQTRLSKSIPSFPFTAADLVPYNRS